MSWTNEFYESRSLGSHFLHTLFAPIQPINPYFYYHLYESLEDESTAEYVRDELIYSSGWILAASIHAYRTGAHVSPMKIWLDGTSLTRVLLQDAGVFRAMSKVAVPLAIADIAYQTYSDPSDNPITRGYEASPISLFFGDHLFQQHGFAGGMNQGLENVKKNLHLA